jgi:hypothetical protein
MILLSWRITGELDLEASMKKGLIPQHTKCNIQMIRGDAMGFWKKRKDVEIKSARPSG